MPKKMEGGSRWINVPSAVDCNVGVGKLESREMIAVGEEISLEKLDIRTGRGAVDEDVDEAVVLDDQNLH